MTRRKSPPTQHNYHNQTIYINYFNIPYSHMIQDHFPDVRKMVHENIQNNLSQIFY